MNKLKFIISIFALFYFSACTDFVDPAIPYSDFQTGVYLRTVETKSNTFNFFDLDNAKWNIVIEVVGENEGKNLAKDVEIYAKRRRGNTATSEVKIRTIQGSEFGAYPGTRVFAPAPNRNFPAKEIIVTAPEALSALGLTKNDVTGGDFIEFRLVLNTNDGRVFTNTNLSADISGGAFYASPFFYRIPLVCPSSLAGDYDYSTVGWCGTVNEGKLKIVATSPAVYEFRLNGSTEPDFSLGAYAACYGPTSTLPGGTLKLNDACNKISFSGQSRWGEVYTFNSVTVNGNVLVLDWKNDYDPEAGVTTITRTDGSNWPALTK